MADEAKTKRRLAKSQFTRAEKAVQLALGLGSECPTWTMEKRYEELKKRWDTVQDAHDSYMVLLDGEEGVESENAWISELEGRFDKMELVVGVHMKEVMVESEVKIVTPNTSEVNIVPPKTQATGSISVETKGRPIVKIELIKFQMFSGDIRKYPLFNLMLPR